MMADLCDGYGTIVREQVDAGGAYQTPAGDCPGCTLCRFDDRYRLTQKAPCSCATSEHPGWTEDESWSPLYVREGWQQPKDRADLDRAWERSEYDGLIPCGWCGGDLWVWRDVTTADDLRSVANDLLILAAELDD